MKFTAIPDTRNTNLNYIKNIKLLNLNSGFA